jgi:hypothetical protein
VRVQRTCIAYRFRSPIGTTTILEHATSLNAIASLVRLAAVNAAQAPYSA